MGLFNNNEFDGVNVRLEVVRPDEELSRLEKELLKLSSATIAKVISLNDESHTKSFGMALASMVDAMEMVEDMKVGRKIRQENQEKKQENQGKPDDASSS